MEPARTAPPLGDHLPAVLRLDERERAQVRLDRQTRDLADWRARREACDTATA